MRPLEITALEITALVIGVVVGVVIISVGGYFGWASTQPTPAAPPSGPQNDPNDPTDSASAVHTNMPIPEADQFRAPTTFPQVIGF